MEFSRPEYWSGWPFLSPGNLPNPVIKPRSPALQVDSLPAEPQGKPRKKKMARLKKKTKHTCIHKKAPMQHMRSNCRAGEEIYNREN